MRDERASSFAGAAQFAAVGYVAGGLPWPAIILLTALPQRPPPAVLARRSRPWLRHVPFARRAVDGPRPDRRGVRARDRRHFRRVGRTDDRGLLDRGGRRRRSSRGTSRRSPGSCSAAQIPDPARFGIDIMFPAAMIGLAVGLITGRRELVAAGAGAAIGVVRRAAREPVGRDRRRAGWSGRWSGCSMPGGARPRDRATRHAGVGRAGTRCRARTSTVQPTAADPTDDEAADR